MQKTEQLLKVLKGQPVIPVLLINNAKDAVPLARALAAGGLPAIEITLRTKDALDVIKRVAGEVENCIVGAGTILDTKQYEKAEKLVRSSSFRQVAPRIYARLQATATFRFCPAQSPRAKSWKCLHMAIRS